MRGFLALLTAVAILVNAVLFTCYGADMIAAAEAQTVADAITLVGLAFLWLGSLGITFKVLRKGLFDS